MKLEVTKVKDINQLASMLQEFKELYNLNQEELIQIAKDESQSFVKRKFIKLISSDDDKISFEAIKYLQSIATLDDIQIDKLLINYKSDGILLNDDQNIIYKKLHKGNNGNMMVSGDIEMLKMLAVNIDHYNKLKLINEATGFKMKFKTGAEQVRPEFTVMKECANNIKEIIDKLGLSSVSAVKNGKVFELTDPLDSLL
jgi:hypothetical protein